MGGLRGRMLLQLFNLLPRSPLLVPDVLALDHVLVSFVDIKHFMLARAVASCGFDSRTGSR